MATSPSGNIFSGWKLTPRTDPGKKTVSKGKDVAFMGSGQKGFLSSPQDYDDTIVEKEVLLGKVSKLENELLDYQYNMGLLLIEKKEWSSKMDEIKQALDKTKDDYRRQQTAHSIALSEVEKREENLRNALGVQKQCVVELEKTLREMRTEYAETKYTADSKLVEANALAASIEEKSLEIESKLRAADAKIAEASRKNSEIERKLRDIEAQESALRRERSSFITERESHESVLSKHKEELLEWERKVKEGEERLADARVLLNQREQRANENDMILRQKQNDLEDEQRKIDAANSLLRKKEDDMSSRLASLALQEKELEDMRKRLEIKEKELDELQEKLNAKEREEIQKLMDEHRAILQSKEEEFELEMRQRRASVDEELKSKVIELEKKEAEVNHADEKLKKREQALEKRNEKLKEKEKDLESKLKALKEREKSLKSIEKELEAEKKLILSEKENSLALRAELENKRAELEKQLLEINKEAERLKITEEEKMEHARLQSELKQEADKCRILRESLVKEAEDLKQEKERFEKEWEELDVKRSEIKKELKEVEKLKKNFEKLQRTEEEKLNKEKSETENFVRREREALKVEQEAFAATMDYERSVLSEKTQSEKIQMLHDFEKRKGELESEMRQKQEEMESALHLREKLFEEERQKELGNAEYLREVARREMEEMKSERERLEKEKREVSANKMHLEEQQFEMKKEIDVLLGLSGKLKGQREAFVNERERFIAFVKEKENCNSCGEAIRLFELSDIENLEAPPPLPSVAQEASGRIYENTSPGAGTMSTWLRKCTSKLLKFSPGKKIELPADQDHVGGPEVGGSEKSVSELPESLLSKEDQPDLVVSINDTFDDQRDNSVREVEESQDTKAGRRRPVRKGRVAKNSKTGLAKVKAADVKGTENNTHVNGGLENMNDEANQKESSLLGEEAPSRNTRKRSRVVGTSQGTEASEFDGSHSDGQSESVTATSRRKRRQKTAPSAQIPAGGRRYNLRRPKSAAAATANGSLSEAVEKSQGENSGSKAAPEATPAVEVSAGDNGELGNSAAAGLPTVVDSSLKDAAADNHQESNAADTANELVDDTGLSEEVNGTPDGGAMTYSAYSEDHTPEESDNEDDDNDEEEEAEHPGEVSIGKKIWSFITT